MNKEVYTYTLLVGLVIATSVLVAGANSYHLPDNQQDYQPQQPIAFSHHMHAGELAIDCQYCHTAAETSRHAGFPSANICMNCHSEVSNAWGAVMTENKRIDELKEAAKKEDRKLDDKETAFQLETSPEIQKLYDALGLDSDLNRDPNKPQTPIEWVKVHNLPDYVYFDHRAHVAVGVDCQTCHGSVESMERVRQVETLSMGWCISCHRESNRIGIKGKPVKASTNCTTCHF